MDIKISCPHCDQHILVDAAYADCVIACPSCLRQLVVVGPSLEPRPDDDASNDNAEPSLPVAPDAQPSDRTGSLKEALPAWMAMREEGAEERHLAEAIHTWVWSGLYSKSEVLALLDDEVAVMDSVDEVTTRSSMQGLVDREFEEKARQEQRWPETTDCDRLDAAFAVLRTLRVITVQNAGYTHSDGLDDVGRIHAQKPYGTYRGYCFYHGQDVARVVQGEGLFLAYGDMQDTEKGKAEVAALIIKVLADHGLDVDWDGDVNHKLSLPKIKWQRRLR